MCRRSQGFAPPRSPLEALLCRHSHLNDDDNDDDDDDDDNDDDDDGRTRPHPNEGNGTVALRPAGGRPVPDDDAGTLLDFEFGVAPLANQANGQLAAALC